MKLKLLLASSLISLSLFSVPYPESAEGSFPEWREKREELLELLLPHDPLIIHGGAYHGNELIRMIIRWPFASIFAMEPNPSAFEILSQRLKDFHFSSLHPIALSDRKGKSAFYLCHGSSGLNPEFEHASSLLPPTKPMEQHLKGPIIEVNCETLPSWCDAHAIDTIDLLSLDLQGSELAVLKSSEELLKKTRCIDVQTYLFAFREGEGLFNEVRSYLESIDFIMLSHWFRKGLEGRALFIERPFLRGDRVNDYLKSHSVDSSYALILEPTFYTLYHIEPSTNDSIKQILKSGKPYEGHIGKIIKNLAVPGTVAIDIGAHIGAHTVTMARKVGSQGAVIAFEPNQKLYMELLDTLSINRIHNVLPIAKGLSDTAESYLLNNISIDQAREEEDLGEWIETITLDSLNLHNISLIKMDVEQCEYFVLKGAKETLQRNRPVIIFECWITKDYVSATEEERKNFDCVMALLDEYDYEVRVIFSNDFIAFPKEATGSLAKEREKFRKLDMKHFDLGL